MTMSDNFPGHPFVDHAVQVAETPSTNDLALQYPDKALHPVVLFLADRQGAGRGRRGNAWWSGDGALLFSLLIATDRLHLPQAQWGCIPLAAGLAVAEGAAEFTQVAPVTVKWPNDVYIGDRKVAGILVEQCPDRPASLVIGIGINVNVDLDLAPPELRHLIAAVACADRPIDIQAVLAAVLDRLQTSLTSLVHSPQPLIAAINQRNYLNGRTITINTGHETIHGTARTISPAGGLFVETAAGRRECLAGTVSLS